MHVFLHRKVLSKTFLTRLTREISSRALYLPLMFLKFAISSNRTGTDSVSFSPRSRFYTLEISCILELTYVASGKLVLFNKVIAITYPNCDEWVRVESMRCSAVNTRNWPANTESFYLFLRGQVETLLKAVINLVTTATVGSWAIGLTIWRTGMTWYYWR